MRHTKATNRKAVVLLAVLVVIVILTLAAYQFSDLMSAENRAADSYIRAAQARALADSGVQYAAAVLASSAGSSSNPSSSSTSATASSSTSSTSPNVIDNASTFQGVLVQPNDSARLQGRFSLMAPLDPDSTASGNQGYRFGMIDEASKINLNAMMQLDSSGKVLHDMLMNLPNMTEDIANCILDWMDADSDPRTNGAEEQYYAGLSPPYHCKNGPLDSLEELLLVKGVTPQLLFGNDFNRNGSLDPDENDGSGAVDRGWSAYLTISSRELNLDSQGNPRIYVNDSDLNNLAEKLTTTLGPDLANYIIAYRMYGGSPTPARGSSGNSSAPTSGKNATSPNNSTSTSKTPSGAAVTPPAGSGGGRGRLTRSNLGNLGGRGRGSQRISSLYQLVNSQVSIPSSTPNGQPTIYPSPLNDSSTLSQTLPILLDEVTTVQDSVLPARINVNTAPSAVLTTLPGLETSDVQAIFSNRPDYSNGQTPDPIYQTPAWLMTQANFTAQKMQALERYITARSQVYRLQSVGYFDGGGPTARVEAMIDANAGRPRVIYFRDLTELGRGYSLQSNP
jgi:type II secretory pathway component PulK